jgi:hypothetical protein
MYPPISIAPDYGVCIGVCLVSSFITLHSEVGYTNPATFPTLGRPPAVHTHTNILGNRGNSLFHPTCAEDQGMPREQAEFGQYSDSHGKQGHRSGDRQISQSHRMRANLP